MNEQDFSIIITEKPGVARKVACALCPGYPCVDRECSRYQRDIFVHHLTKIDKANHPVRFLRCKLSSLPKNRWRSYWYDRTIDWSRVSLIHSDSVHGPGARQVLRSLKQILSDQRDSRGVKAIVECVDWYMIRKGYLGCDWMVMHTAGNPQQLDMRSDASPGEGTAATIPTHPRQLAAAMRRVPVQSGSKATRMRLAHMRRMFHLGQKSGHGLYIATDQDIAGTFLASVLPGFRKLAEVSKPLRVRLNETTKSGVRQAIQDAAEFDWHNAEAGRLRDSVDYVVGHALNGLLRHTPAGKRRAPGFTVGRTRLLALDCLCRRWLEARHSKTVGSIFLVFPGVGDQTRIEQDLADGSALMIAAAIQRGFCSQAGLLRELLRCKVGTVSTRYKLIASLLEQGLIQEHGPWLVPSLKGLLVEQHLLELLEGPNFSLWDWQDRLTEFLATAATRSGVPLLHLEQQVDAFLQEFLLSFHSVLASASPVIHRLRDALDALLPHEQTPKSVEEANTVNADRSHHGNAGELGLEGAVPIDRLARYVDTNANLLSTNGPIHVSRIVPQPEWDWDGMLRRQLLLEREVAFRLVESVNIHRLIELSDIPCTVFRADCDPRTLSGLLRVFVNGKAKLSKPVMREVKLPAEELTDAGAHPPLEIFDPCPADMRGPEALLVAQEYMRPYEYTIGLLEAHESGQKLLDSFQCNRFVFRRIEPFEFGTAHTFDTVLATMYDRYGMTFEDTANITESLYLGGGTL